MPKIPVLEVEYREISNYPGYKVGNDGSVWSCKRGGEWRRRVATPAPNGYHIVSLSRSGYVKYVTVHSLVLEAFVGPRPRGMQVRHFPNRDQSDNRLCNLSWATPVVNNADKKAQGTEQRGETASNVKLKDVDVLRIRSLRGKVKQSDLAAEYGVWQSTISFIQRGATWTHLLPPIEGS